MTFLIQRTLIYAVPLLIVALAGIFAERSGVINLALEGIMIFGAFIGILAVRLLQATDVFNKDSGQLVMLLAMLATALLGAVFSLLLAFAAIHLKADQTIGGTALNMLAPALVLFLVYIMVNQASLDMDGDAPTWFMIRKDDFGIADGADFCNTGISALDKTLNFLGNTFLDKFYPAPISALDCLSFSLCCCTRPSSVCVCAPAAKIPALQTRSVSMCKECGMQAFPFRAHSAASAVLCMPSPRLTALQPVRLRASASLPSLL